MEFYLNISGTTWLNVIHVKMGRVNIKSDFVGIVQIDDFDLINRTFHDDKLNIQLLDIHRTPMMQKLENYWLKSPKIYKKNQWIITGSKLTDIFLKL